MSAPSTFEKQADLFEVMAELRQSGRAFCLLTVVRTESVTSANVRPSRSTRKQVPEGSSSRSTARQRPESSP